MAFDASIGLTGWSGSRQNSRISASVPLSLRWYVNCPTHVDSGATPFQINVRGTDNHVATPQLGRRSSRILRNRSAGFEGHSGVVQSRNTAGVL
jgi:hypothetical protein